MNVYEYANRHKATIKNRPAYVKYIFNEAKIYTSIKDTIEARQFLSYTNTTNKFIIICLYEPLFICYRIYEQSFIYKKVLALYSIICYSIYRVNYVGGYLL